MRKVAPPGKPLSYDKIRAFQERGARVRSRAFGENLVVEGIDSGRSRGTKLECGDVVLEITPDRKGMHHGCRIFQEMGECIMPGKASSRE